MKRRLTFGALFAIAWLNVKWFFERLESCHDLDKRIINGFVELEISNLRAGSSVWQRLEDCQVNAVVAIESDLLKSQTGVKRLERNESVLDSLP